MKLRDAPLVALMMALAAQYPRYGYRRIAVFMEREGHKMGPDKAYRLWLRGRAPGAEEASAQTDCSLPAQAKSTKFR